MYLIYNSKQTFNSDTSESAMTYYIITLGKFKKLKLKNQNHKARKGELQNQ